MHRKLSTTLWTMTVLALLFTTVWADAPDSAIPEGWLERAVDGLAAREYRFAGDTSAGGWSAPNRAQGFRTHIGVDGTVVITPRRQTAGEEGAHSWRLTFRLAAIGRDDELRQVSEPIVEVAEERVTLRRGGIDEWYVNDERGIEQGFTVHAPLPGNGPLRIELRLDPGLTAAWLERGQGVRFEDSRGLPVARYDRLYVDDAAGVEVDSWLELAGERLFIVVDDREAIYPLHVDPVVSSPSFTAESNQIDARFGFSASTAGDLDGDGFGDLIVGADQYDGGQTDEGAVFIYMGSASGLSSTPDKVIEGNQAFARFGAMVSTAGDPNGDGFGDVMVGAPSWDGSFRDEGQVFLFIGGRGGIETTPLFTFSGQQDSARCGQAISAAGDVNGDGYDDVIFSSDLFDNGSSNEGRVYLFYGNRTHGLVSAGWNVESNQTDAFMGWSLSGAGDINGDGYDDFIVASPFYDSSFTDRGRVWIYHGAANPSKTPARILQGDEASEQFGYSVSRAGDVNGDGYADIIIGSRLWDDTHGNEGRAQIFQGSSGGILSTPLWSRDSNETSAEFGRSVGTAGDVNGDGYADVIVGAALEDNGQTDEGTARVYLGGPDGPGSSSYWFGDGDQSDAYYGFRVDTAGDVNGDGFSDVLVTAYNYRNGQSGEGRAFVYHGGGDDLANSAAWDSTDNYFLGQQTARAIAIGDQNDDGYSDVALGAPGANNEGRVFIYWGGPDGLPDDPCKYGDPPGFSSQMQYGYSLAFVGNQLFAGAPRYDGDWPEEGAVFTVGSGQAGTGCDGGLAGTGIFATGDWTLGRFGESIADAGDVDGDGVRDLIVGEPGYNVDRGAVSIFYRGDLDDDADWFLQGGEADAEFGSQVAGAGDIDGDGFSDVLISAIYADNGVRADAGQVFLFEGRAGGPDYSSDWTIRGVQSNERFGFSIAGAGSVNGDRFSDVAIGSPYWDDTSLRPDAGRVLVFHGAVTGLPTFANRTFEGSSTGYRLGYDVSTAGDVDADGYSDLVFGAEGQTTNGIAFLYRGGAGGLASGSSWAPSASYGEVVAGGGDVNGDGFSDVIVGDPGVDTGLWAGEALLYYGGGRPGLPLIPRQKAWDGSYVMPLLSLTDTPTGFRVTALGRSAAGRTRVRLQVERRDFGTVFSDSATTSGSTHNSGAPGSDGSVYDELSRTVSTTPGELYHWQARVDTDDPHFPHSIWLMPQGNGEGEMDLQARCDVIWYYDGDGDGYGRNSGGTDTCYPPADYVTVDGDCDDSNPAVNPGQDELECDGLDNDCSPATQDAPDVDGDGWDICDPGEPGDSDGNPVDCSPGDGSAYAVPGEVRDLRLSDDGLGNTTLSWMPPLQPGGTPSYDSIRSDDAADFSQTGPGECIETSGADQSTLESFVPARDQVVFYLVRASTPCGYGTAGYDSSGAERDALICP
ncbi:hypothetical protein ABI59_06590 [Acidobacteria bacterium Mor1]|nr:hypothetical protein ABI59_06590 [Acidobacteria bacterium Mor1]